MTAFKTFYVVNPVAGSGCSQQIWNRLADHFKEGTSAFQMTQAPGDASKLTRQALTKGYEMVIAVGGDGTLNECLNGFIEKDKPVNPNAVLGILPSGRGSDFARGLKLLRESGNPIEHLLDSKTRLIDVGKSQFVGEDGTTQLRYFINIANVGLASDVDRYSAEAPKALGSKFAYFYGIIRSLVSFKPADVSYSNGTDFHQSCLLNMILANGSYFGSGIKAAPKAKLDDGNLDVLVIPKMSFYKLLANLPRFYSGDYVKIEDLEFFRRAKVEVSAIDASKKIPVEMDGDFVGYLPASFEILPKILKFKV